MKEKGLYKSIIYKIIILLILMSAMISGCTKEKAEDGDNKKISDISVQNDINQLPKEELETEENVEPTEMEEQSTQTSQKESQTISQKETTKDYSINSNSVIQNAVSNLKSTIPELVYSGNMTRGQVVDVSIPKELSEQDVSGMLHDAILDLVEYDLYLEYQNNPNQSHPVVLDYTYSLKYKGFSTDNTMHVFEFKFVMNEQQYKDEHFDSSVVVSQVTERILNHTGFHMSRLSSDNYTEARMIEGVQTYENTAEAVESLTRYVENEIDGALFGMAGYTQFKVEYYAKGANSYTFILYLK